MAKQGSPSKGDFARLESCIHLLSPYDLLLFPFKRVVKGVEESDSVGNKSVVKIHHAQIFL